MRVRFKEYPREVLRYFQKIGAYFSLKRPTLFNPEWVVEAHPYVWGLLARRR